MSDSLYAAPPSPLTYYVSPSGSDVTGDGSLTNPWLTIQHGEATIRASGVLVNMTRDIVLCPLPGDYWLGEGSAPGTVSFTEANNGSNGRYFRLKADAINTVRILGGRRVTGWSLYSGSIYRVAISETPSTIYENGVRGIQARYPALVPDVSYPSARAPYLTSTGVASSQTVLQYGAGELNPAAWTATNIGVFIWSGAGAHVWTTDRIPVASVDTGTRRITLSGTTNMEIGTGSRYFVEGDISFLVGPGQWVVDGGYLYYWPRSTPIASQEIVIPTVRKAISLAGSGTGAGQRISHVSVENIETAFSDFAPNWQANNGSNFSVQRQGHVHVENSDHVTIDRCNIHHSGGHAVLRMGYSQFNTITNSWIHHTGGHGLYDLNPSLVVDQVLNNVARNLKINNVGELVGESHGILNIDAGFSVNEYLTIYNSPRGAIATEGQYPTVMFQRSNNWRNIDIHDCVQDSGDFGSIYIVITGSSGSPGTDFFDQITIAQGSAIAGMTDAQPKGLYTDFDSYGQSFSNFWVTSYPVSPMIQASSGNHTLSNVSFTPNSATPEPTFKSERMSWTGVTRSFPY